MAAAAPIQLWYREGDGFPQHERIPEDDAETFAIGVPIFIDSDGFARVVSDDFGGSELIYGISAERGHNLTTANTATQGNEGGTPQNQTSAVTTAVGSPMVDGKVAVIRPRNHLWRIALLDGQTFTQTLVEPATRYDLNLQANGYWCVDSLTTGTDPRHAVHIRGVDPNNSAFVLCTFASAALAA